MEFDPRIERYFDMDLSENERAVFLSELELNSELKAQFDLYQLIIEGIQSEGRAELKEYIKSRVDEQSTNTQTNLWFYAAASVTVLLLGYFAIYKYVETGSLKESAEYITLKDEKSERVKFWKNKKLGKKFLPEIFFGKSSDSSEVDNHWTDSLLAVYSESHTPAPDEIAPNTIEKESEISENDINSNDDVISNLSYEKKSRMAVSEAESAAPTMAPGITSGITSYGVKDKVKKSTNYDTVVLERRTISTSRVVAIHLPGIIESKTQSTSVAPSTVKTNPQRFNIIQQEARDEKPAIEFSGNKIYLINLGSENPLLYEIDGNFYLELGPKNILSIKPNVPRIEKPKPITDKTIIEKIQPK